MSDDALGAVACMIIALLLGVSHLLAAQNPDRNWVTRLLAGYYERIGNLSSKQSMLIISILAFVCFLLGFGGLLFELLR